ncbi:hypothetical protein Elgi_38230 [Paenibacillus elgii]|uniref:hypothetical protein n=1 Tax=Paenibacillus elgii TaxID=189691 RepID=UPI002D7B1E50|nr:hypothetical protein Elgi_38230 [Paenibacillus elgii]
MENKLVVCVQGVSVDEAESKIKEALYKNYMISEDDFTETEDQGFEFLFCDEGGGDVMIECFPFPEFTQVEISGEFDCDTIAVHKLIVETLFSELS